MKPPTSAPRATGTRRSERDRLTVRARGRHHWVRPSGHPLISERLYVRLGSKSTGELLNLGGSHVGRPRLPEEAMQPNPAIEEEGSEERHATDGGLANGELDRAGDLADRFRRGKTDATLLDYFGWEGRSEPAPSVAAQRRWVGGAGWAASGAAPSLLMNERGPGGKEVGDRGVGGGRGTTLEPNGVTSGPDYETPG